MSERCSKTHLINNALPNMLVVIGHRYSPKKLRAKVPQVSSKTSEVAVDIIADPKLYHISLPVRDDSSDDDDDDDEEEGEEEREEECFRGKYPWGTQVYINRKAFRTRTVTPARAKALYALHGGKFCHNLIFTTTTRTLCWDSTNGTLCRRPTLLLSTSLLHWSPCHAHPPPTGTLNLESSALSSLKKLEKNVMSLEVAEKVRVFRHGKVQMDWVSRAPQYSLRGESVSSLVAKHLDEVLDVNLMVKRLNPTARVGRKRNSAPGREHQPPEMQQVNRLTGETVMAMAGGGRKKRQQKKRKKGAAGKTANAAHASGRQYTGENVAKWFDQSNDGPEGWHVARVHHRLNMFRRSNPSERQLLTQYISLYILSLLRACGARCISAFQV